jgi:hypothetical protein
MRGWSSVVSRQRTACSYRRGMRLAGGSELRAIRCHLARMLDLGRDGAGARIARHCQLLRGRPSIDSAAPAVVACAAAIMVRHPVAVYIVVYDRRVDIRDRAVIPYAVVIPIGAVVAAARVTEAIIYAAIKSNVRAPITGMEKVNAVIESPPWRRPERADPWRQYPGARHPVVADVISGVGVSPIARSPNVIFAGTRRLAVIHQRRWRFGYFHDRLIRRAGILGRSRILRRGGILVVCGLVVRRLGICRLAVILRCRRVALRSRRVALRSRCVALSSIATLVSRREISVLGTPVSQRRRFIRSIACNQPCAEQSDH